MIEITALASGSTGNCYRVTDGSTPLLLEVGISMPKIQHALNYSLSSIQGCLLSHEHMDHAWCATRLMERGIDCYMSQGTAEALKLARHHRLHVLKPREQVQVGTWTVLPFETQHDAAEPLGYLLASGDKKVLFATDTYYVKYRFRGLTHVMVECNYSQDILDANVEAGLVPAAMRERLLRSHFSLENVKDFLRANDLSRVKEIWLLHLSDGNSDEARFKREVQELTGKPVYIAGER